MFLNIVIERGKKSIGQFYLLQNARKISHEWSFITLFFSRAIRSTNEFLKFGRRWHYPIDAFLPQLTLPNKCFQVVFGTLSSTNKQKTIVPKVY